MYYANMIAINWMYIKTAFQIESVHHMLEKNNFMLSILHLLMHEHTLVSMCEGYTELKYPRIGEGCSIVYVH